MKRLPLVMSFLLFILLCASIAYWGMQLFKPPLRPVAAPPRATTPEVRVDAAAALFGGRPGKVATASNYQLKGVIFSGNPRDSVAILGADGKPPQAVRANTEFMPGVKVQEVHRDYVLLAEGGATKRVDLPENAPMELGAAATPPTPVTRTPTPPPSPPVVGVPSRAQTAAAGGVPAPVVPSGSVPAQQQNAPAAGAQPNTAVPAQVPGQSTTTAPPSVVASPPPGSTATPGGTSQAQPGAVPQR